MNERTERIYEEETETKLAYRGGQLQVTVCPAQYVDADAAGQTFIATGIRICTPHMHLFLDAEAANELRYGLFNAAEKHRTAIITSQLFAHVVSLLPMEANTTITLPFISQLVWPKSEASNG